MRRRSKSRFWAILLLILAVGFVIRGRTTTAPATAAAEEATTPEQHGAPPAHQEDERQLHLHVVAVHDGDTITGLDEHKTQHKIRLDAIDAPELGQPFGQASKKALSEKVFGKDVVVIPKAHDKYGRTVGHVIVDRRDVDLEMLEEGMAWHYEHFDHNKRLREAADGARTARRGLWADPNAIPPWEFRKQRHHGK